jgi:phosphoribosylformylglycinamidine synthase I
MTRRVCVLRMEGTNCEQETVEAFRAVGAEAEAVHIRQLADDAPADRARDLDDYDVLAIPGGASGGDAVRPGAVFAARIEAAVGTGVHDFAASGRPVLGICNGFQTLAELGLLPGSDMSMAFAVNMSARIECRPVTVRFEREGDCPFTDGIIRGKILELPVSHRTGRIVGDDPRFVEKLEDGDQVVLRYTGPDNREAEYPWNPSGSPAGIAAVCNPEGNVLGMMVHPERVMTRYTHPDWTRRGGPEQGDGRAFFESVVRNRIR